MKLSQLLKPTVSQPYKFPKEAFDILYKNDYFLLPHFRISNVDQQLDETTIILNDLIEIGYADLAVGRIYEGHINALLLIDEYGTPAQKEKYFAEAKAGEIFGIWNSEHPSEAMTFESGTNGYILKGAKTFCSGSLDVTRPIITAQNKNGKQMILLELENHPELEEDTSFWNVMGMESTVSHRIDFSDLQISESQLIGQANDYDREPKISTGAIRFAAVQFGGAKAIADIAIQHLIKTHRADNPIQNTRIAELGILSKVGHLWFDEYASIDTTNPLEHINYVNMVRTDILRICESILSISEKAIGVQGFLKSHPFEKKYRDLKVYLKQPNPDLALEKIGKYYSHNGKVD